MKCFFYIMVFCFTIIQTSIAQNQWAWMNGNKSPDVKSSYGTRGAAASSNIPGSRMGTATWKDKDGNLWLFGGNGKGESSRNGLLNDLWKYNPSSGIWTWMGGNKNINSTGKYGSRGTPSIHNLPGARQNAVSWTDNQGNFWLFGGLGMIAKKEDTGGNSGNGGNGGNGGNNGNGNGNNGNGNNGNGNGGSNKDDDDDKDDKDKDNNGRGGDDAELESSEEGLLNDLWKYSPSTGEWTWVSGKNKANEKGEYGDRTRGSGSNIPGSRAMSTGWKDAGGNLWLFGGRGYSSRSEISDLNDVWKYSPNNNQWTWMKGSRTNNADEQFGQKGVFAEGNTPNGRRGSSAWTDNDGNFWMFGGASRSGLFGDLWKYDTHGNRWAWISGSKNADHDPVFKGKGVPDRDANPGSRILASGWVDAAGNLWLFGGEGYGGRAGTKPVNNLWKYNVATGEWTFVKGEISISPDAVYGSRGEPANENNPGGTANFARWKDENGNFWMFGGLSSSGLLNQTWKFSACGGEITGSIAPAAAAICGGGSQQLTASGGSSYQWFRNNEMLEGETKASIIAKEPGTYNVIIKHGGCIGAAINSAVITLATAPSGTISPASASVCGGSTQVLTATGGTSYTWLRDGITIHGETESTITISQPGTYSVVISNGSCTGPASNSVDVTSNSAAGIRYTDIFATPGVPTRLSAREIGVSYEWTPAIGLNNTSSVIPMVTTSSDRQYIVNITTEQGCIISDTVLVKINADKKVLVPTAFTPNGNGVNDLLRPLGNLANIDYFRVFNRWGAMLFQTSEMGAGWDGRYKGVNQAADTYTWLLSGKTADGQSIKLSGKSLLIR